MEIRKYCIRNSEDRCIQCRDYAPRKRVCPAYRIQQQQRRDAVEASKREFREFLNVVN